jgi:hypothetical protein
MIRLVLKSGVCATVWYPKCNAKHTRCICGIASQVPWKIGFCKEMMVVDLAIRSVIDTREILQIQLKRK